MRKIWLFIILSFNILFQSVFAADSGPWSVNIPTVNNIWIWSSTVNVDLNLNTSQTTTNTTSNSTVVKTNEKIVTNSWITDNWATVLPFCNVNNKSWIKDEYKSNKVWVRENNYIVLTYINTYWRWYLDEINKDKKTNIISKYQIVEASWSSSHPQRGIYNNLEQQCIKFRLEHPDNNEVIINLYKQVKFFSKYYSTYPDRLTEWITPGFLILWIDLVDTLSTYILLFVVLNIIVWTVLYMTGPIDKKEDYWNRVILSFWYLLIVGLLKIWVLGSIIALIWYEWLDFLKLFLP